MHGAEQTSLLNRNVNIANFELYEFVVPLVDKHTEQKYDIRRRSVYCSVKWSFAWYNFGKMTFGQMMFRENDIRLNDDSLKWRSAEGRFGKMTFGWTTIGKNVVRHYEVWLIRWFGHLTIRSNNFRRFFFDKSMILLFFRQNNDSAKFHFGKTTIRWNDVSGKWCGPKSRVRQLCCKYIVY